jgi:hypothetical protein
MLEILQYATSSFWIFIGCAILLSIATGPLYGLAATLGAIISVRR